MRNDTRPAVNGAPSPHSPAHRALPTERASELATYWPLALALAIYVALRAAILCTAFDAVSLPMFELYPMGTIAELELSGVDFPLQYFYDNAAGQVLMGIVTIPYFALLGASYLALKLVPATLGAATLVLLYAFLRANFSRGAAAVGALCFALAPTTLVKYSLVNSGNHFENLVFTMLLACAFYRVHRARDDRAWLFATGLAAGLAVFVFLGALVPLASFALLHVVARGFRRSVRDLVWTLPGLALGCLPLVFLNLEAQKGLGFLQAKFAADGAGPKAHVAERAREFLTEHLPRASLYPAFGGVSGRAADAAFLIAFVIAYVACVAWLFVPLLRAVVHSFGSPRANAERPRPSFEELKLLPFVACLPVTALAYGFSNLKIGGYAPPVEMGGYRYFLPHFLFAIVLVAVLAARWWSEGTARRWAAIALAAVVLGAGTFNVGLIDFAPRDAWVGRHYAGYNLAQLARALLGTRNALSPESVAEHVETLPVAWRHHVVTAIGFNQAVHEIEELEETARSAGARASGADADHEWTLVLDPLFASWPVAWRPDLARGAGVALRWMLQLEGRGIDGLDAHLARIAAREPAHAERVVEGACLLGVAVPQTAKAVENLASNRRLLDSCSPSLRADVARGSGFLCGRLVPREIASERAAVDASFAHAGEMLDEREQAAWWEGVGAGLADGSDAVGSPQTYALSLRAADGEALWFGFGAALRHNLGPELAGRTVAGWKAALAEAERRALERGLARDDSAVR